MNLNQIFLIIAVLLFALPLSATEKDWEYEIKPEVLKEMVEQEKIIKDNRTIINQQDNYLIELYNQLEKAFATNNENRLKKVLVELVKQLVRMQERVEEQDIRTEKFRVSSYRAWKNAERKKIPSEGDALDDSEFLKLRSLIIEEMSEEEQISTDPRISNIQKVKGASKRIRDMRRKIPGNATGLREKHVFAALDRIWLNSIKELYFDMGETVIDIIELYTYRDLSEGIINEGDYGEYLNILDEIIDTLIEEKTNQ